MLLRDLGFFFVSTGICKIARRGKNASAGFQFPDLYRAKLSIYPSHQFFWY